MFCVTFLCLSLLASQASGEEFWMRPNLTMNCSHGSNCITLSDMIADTSRYTMISNLTIHVLPGVHKPNQSEWITLGHSQRSRNKLVSFIGHSKQCNEFYCDVVIECEPFNLGITIDGTREVHVTNLIIKKCGLIINKELIKHTESTSGHSLSRLVDKFLTTQTAMMLSTVMRVSLVNVHIHESKGYGLLVFRQSGNITITNCSFKRNNWKNKNRLGGNIFILADCYRSNICVLSISHSTVSNGKASNTRGGEWFYIQAASGGATIKFLGPVQSKTAVVLHNNSFSNNYADKGASLYISTYQDRYISKPGYDRNLPNITIQNCTFRKGIADISGGAMYIEVWHRVKFDDRLISVRALKKFTLRIKNSTFISNRAHYGGAIALKYARLDWYPEDTGLASYYENPMETTITNSIFDANEAVLGGAIYHCSTHNTSQNFITITFTLNLIFTNFTNNTATDVGGAIHIRDINYNWVKPDCCNPIVKFSISFCHFEKNIAKSGSAIWQMSKPVSTAIPFVIMESTFQNNRGVNQTISGAVIYLEHSYTVLKGTALQHNMVTPLHINQSQIAFYGDNYITDNTAEHGAAMFLECSPSQFILTNTTSLYISRNKATAYGGGIAVGDGCSLHTPAYAKNLLCFFQLHVPKLLKTTLVFMKNNTAGIAGNDIYGGDLEYCHFRDGSFLTLAKLTSMFQMETFQSAVVSRPYRVCTCTNSYRNCTQNLSVSIFPGQEFQVPVVGAGQFYNPSPAVIRAELHTPDGYTAQLGDRQTTQDTRDECKNVTYSIQTKAKTVTLQLSIERPLINLNFPPAESAFISVSVRDCPLGFELVNINSNQPVCGCVPHLKTQGLQCNINTQTIHRDPSMWIGNFSDDIIVHHNCPLDYCGHEVDELDPNSQDTQCNFNRSGVLCGGCPPGLSLALGTSQCLECSHTYLLLLLLFALAGVILVIILLKLDITVSTGTINGLIFYANIVQANRALFFPVKGVKYISYFLSIFIAWLNLDFGFEVCFTDNLNAFTRTWLQFVFPLYIWLMVAVLILVSRYSVTVSRLTGSNTVSVLATLFLLSYSKLLQTTLKVFSFTTLTDSNTTATAVWLLDGNYLYLQWPHAALFTAALVTVVAHLLPFMLLLSLAPFLQRYTHFRVLRRIFRFKPLLDAYQGPYKVKLRWWTGLMLLARLFLFTTFAVNALGNPQINLLVTDLVVLILFVVWLKFGRVYRKAPINALEVFFILNLGIYVAAVLCIQGATEEENLQKIISCCMVGSTFIVFLLILAYHCYTVFSRTIVGRKMVSKVKDFVTAKKSHTNSPNDEIPVQPESPTVSYVAMSDLREPLLDE